MTDNTDRLQAMLWGALVADAAAMGLHWLYDQERIVEVGGAHPEFHGPDPADFEGFRGVFVHSARKSGDLSHYGEQMRVMMRAVAAGQGYRRATYVNEFERHFGYGGAFVGYIDRATRDSLNNMAKIRSEADADADMARVWAENAPGSNDVQVPALSKLPPLIARHLAADNLLDLAEDAIRVTNNNDLSVEFGRFAAAILAQVAATGHMADLQTLAEAAARPVQEAVLPVFQRLSETTQEVTLDIGMPCNLVQAVPSVVHNLATATSYAHAIRSNIQAGGDNCGRAITLGAVMGAVHGIGGDTGIPIEWINKLRQHAEIKSEIDGLMR